MKKKIIILIGAILLIALNVYLAFTTITNKVYDVDPNTKQEVVGELVDGTEITQEFTTEQSELGGFSLKFANYEREKELLEGSLVITMSTIDGQVLSEDTVDVKDVKNNEVYTISYEEPIKLPSKHLVLSIKAVGSQPEHAVTIYAFNEGTKDTVLTMNEQKLDAKTLYMTTQYDTFSVQRLIYLTVFVLLLYGYILFVLRAVVSKK